MWKFKTVNGWWPHLRRRAPCLFYMPVRLWPPLPLIAESINGDHPDQPAGSRAGE